MFKGLQSKGCYYPLEFSNLPYFAFKNSINMLPLVKANILHHGKKGSALKGDVYIFVFPIQVPILLIFTLPVSALYLEHGQINSVCLIPLLSQQGFQI